MQENIYGRCAALVPEGQNETIRIDLSLFLERILLFDKYVLSSIRLKEIPLFAKFLSVDGLIELLDSDSIKIHCDALTTAQLGQANVQSAPSLPRPLPNFSYSFSNMSIAYRDVYIDRNMRCLNDILGISSGIRNEIEEKIRRSLVMPSREMPLEMFRQFMSELVGGLPLASVKNNIERSLWSELELTLHQVRKEDWRVETNLSDLMKTDDLSTHKLIERSLLDVSGLTQRLFYMKEFSAISEFRNEHDTNLLFHKLRPLGEQFTGKPIEDQYLRVLRIRGFPSLSDAIDKGSFNINKFLKVRNSEECQEFRTWLRSLHNATDQEISERVNGLRSKLGNALNSKKGRVVRVVTNMGLGLIGPVISTGASLIDSFILDKLVKSDGVSAFINKLYKSLHDGG